MPFATVRYKAGKLHLFTASSASGVDHCSDEQTHTVLEFLNPLEFVCSVEREADSVAILRAFLLSLRGETNLFRWTDEQVLESLAEQISQGAIKTVLCGRQTGVRSIRCSDGKRNFHLVSGNAGRIVCSQGLHAAIGFQAFGDSQGFAEKLLIETQYRSTILKYLELIAPSTDAGKQLTEQIHSGRIRVIECRAIPASAGAVSKSDEGRVESSSAARAGSKSSFKVKTWIEILLRDQKGNPIPNEKYSVKLPDGSKREGSLDGDGGAHIDQIDPGTCLVSFPDIDALEWRPS